MEWQNKFLSQQGYQYVDPGNSLPISDSGYALIGVSPFNGYFTQENLERLFAWAMEVFLNVEVFIPNEISAYTFQALGYPDAKARRKTKRQDSYLKNKVIKALEANGLTTSQAQEKIILLSDLKDNENYLTLYSDCLEFFKTDEDFRKGCLSTSKWVIAGKEGNVPIGDEALFLAAQYFLAELPLFLDSPRIFNKDSCVFVYKDMPEFLREIYEKSHLVSPGQRFLIESCQAPAAPSS